MTNGSIGKQISLVDFSPRNAFNTFQPPVDNVRSFILNHSAPKTLEELLIYIRDHGRYNLEDILQETNLEEWSVPRWAGIGDIIFFMHAKTADQTFRNLRKDLNKAKYSENDYYEMSEWIDRGLELHKKYGGKIVAIGQVVGPPVNIQPVTEDEKEYSQTYHWKSSIYALVNHVHPLANPVDISDFNSFIHVSRRGGITPIFGESFDQLRALISKNNEVPAYFLDSTVSEMPFSSIDKNNWLQVTRGYRRRFILEEQLRSYYTNHLLRELGSFKTIYRECRCRKADHPDAFIDNVIRFGEKYLPVEIKLSVSCERNIEAQLSKYCSCNSIILDDKRGLILTEEKIFQQRVLVIDRDHVYIFREEDETLQPIFSLKELEKLDDIAALKKIVAEHI